MDDAAQATRHSVRYSMLGAVSYSQAMLAAARAAGETFRGGQPDMLTEFWAAKEAAVWLHAEETVQCHTSLHDLGSSYSQPELWKEVAQYDHMLDPLQLWPPSLPMGMLQTLVQVTTSAAQLSSAGVNEADAGCTCVCRTLPETCTTQVFFTTA